MSDFKLDTNHDLDFSTGDLQILSGAEAARQQLIIRFRMFQGEYFLDAAVGFPWFQDILGKKVRTPVITSLVRETALTTPRIQSVSNIEIDYSAATRLLELSFDATTDEGEVINFDTSFVIGRRATGEQ